MDARSLAHVVALTAGLALLVGCHLIAPYASGSSDAGGAVIAEAAPGDTTPGDAARDDGPRDDGQRDGPTPGDRAAEQPAVDLGGPGGDLAADSAPAEAGTDSQPALACFGDAVPTLIYAPTMVVCESPGRQDTQCGAETAFCAQAAGWSMCTASQFLAQGGATTPANGAWLKACVRDGGDPFAPIDAICSACSGGKGDTVDVMWGCKSGGAMFPWDSALIGVAAQGACLRVGEDTSATEGYWTPYATLTKLSAAVCCQ